MKTFQQRILSRILHGKKIFYIVVPAALTASHKRKHEYFKSRAAAMARAVELNKLLWSRERAAVLSIAQQADAVRAYALLQEMGLGEVSLVDAVAAAEQSLRRRADAVSLGELLDGFRSARWEGWSVKSRKNFRVMAGYLAERFGAEMSVGDLAAVALGDWLSERFGSPGYRANAIRTLSPAFNWGVRAGLIKVNPFDAVERPKVRRGRIDVLSVEEARAAMLCCPADCVAAAALMLFGGVRPEEVTRLRWADVMEDVVHLSPEVTKTAQVRNVRLNETLRAWLDACRRGGDLAAVVPANWPRKYKAWRAAAGIAKRQDVLRHSFATYHLRHWGDEAALRRDMGHSRNSEVLFAHYLAAATPAQAREFWAILPKNRLENARGAR